MFVDVSGDAGTAEQMFGDAYAREPGNASVTWYFAKFLAKHGRLQEALDLIDATPAERAGGRLLTGLRTELASSAR